MKRYSVHWCPFVIGLVRRSNGRVDVRKRFGVSDSNYCIDVSGFGLSDVTQFVGGLSCFHYWPFFWTVSQFESICSFSEQQLTPPRIFILSSTSLISPSCLSWSSSWPHHHHRHRRRQWLVSDHISLLWISSFSSTSSFQSPPPLPLQSTITTSLIDRCLTNRSSSPLLRIPDSGHIFFLGLPPDVSSPPIISYTQSSISSTRPMVNVHSASVDKTSFNRSVATNTLSVTHNSMRNV